MDKDPSGALAFDAQAGVLPTSRSARRPHATHAETVTNTASGWEVRAMSIALANWRIRSPRCCAGHCAPPRVAEPEAAHVRRRREPGRPVPGGAGHEETTPPRLRACGDCGQFQMVPALAPGSVARCVRCDAILRRARRDPLGRGLALSVTALGLLFIVRISTLLTVSTFGMYRSATLFTGPVGFGEHRVWFLALVVAFMTVLAPLLRLLAGDLRARRPAHGKPPRHLRAAFRWAEWLRPWAMIEVFLLGFFVAYTELPGSVHVEIGIGVYALIALMVTMIAADAVLDRQAVWEEMERRGLPDAPWTTRQRRAPLQWRAR